jgi:hypothetical protein
MMRLLAWVSLALLAAAYICRPIADPDLWWHITVGRWILSHRAVPSADYWNMFGVGQPWLAYSWSNEALYALIDNFYGEKGLVIAQLLLAVGIALTMQYVCSSLSGSLWIGAFLGAYTVLCFHAHFSLRPQSLVWILFAVCLLLAERSRRVGLSKWQLLGTAALGCCWANTHLSAVLGLGSLVVWHVQPGPNRMWLWRAACMAGCFLAGTLVTPYFGQEWFTAFEIGDHIGRFREIDEFRPATLLDHVTGMLLFQIVLLGLVCFLSRVVPPTGGMLVAVGALLAGFGVVKFLPFAAIVLSVLIAIWWREWKSAQCATTAEIPLVRVFEMVDEKLNRLHPQTLGASGFFMCCVAWVYAASAIKHPVDETKVPKSSIAFLQERNLKHPVLNDMGTGGFLMYQWSSREGEPSHLVALDGRTNVNSPVVWRSMEKALHGREGWSEYIRLVNPKTIVWPDWSPFVALLLESPDWCRVFQSGRSRGSMSVFVNREEFDSRGGEFQSSDCQPVGAGKVS